MMALLERLSEGFVGHSGHITPSSQWFLGRSQGGVIAPSAGFRPLAGPKVRASGSRLSILRLLSAARCPRFGPPRSLPLRRSAIPLGRREPRTTLAAYPSARSLRQRVWPPPSTKEAPARRERRTLQSRRWPRLLPSHPAGPP